MRPILLFILLWALSPLALALEVLASVHPLSLITAAITDGVTQPRTLVPPGSSPHDYALRPSDVRRLRQADLVIWVGPELERFLVKPLAPLTQVLTLAEQPTLTLYRRAGTEEEHHGEATGDETAEHHEHGTDLHIWLGPEQAREIARLISRQLQQRDPGHADTYAANLARFEQQLTQADQAIARRMQTLAAQGYFVFHDAYGYWERHYAMRNLGHFTLNPEQHPGARKLAEIQARLKAGQARCVFAEPQFQPAQIRAVTRGSGVAIGILDPLGSNISVTNDGYIRFMHQLADQFEHCLTQP